MGDSVSLLNVTLFGLLAGVVGTGGGGLIAMLIKKPSQKLIGTMLGFSAGIMMTIVFLELVEESLKLSGTFVVILGLAVGIFAFLFIDSRLPHHHVVSSEAGDSSMMRKGHLIAMGIALHNFPEGLAIGAGFAFSTELGFGLALIIALHNIPEGLAVALPLKVGVGDAGVRALFVSLLVGLPMAVGAFLGGLIGNLSPGILGFSLSFAGGAMLYIVCDELIPDIFKTTSAHVGNISILDGIIFGILILAI